MRQDPNRMILCVLAQIFGEHKLGVADPKSIDFNLEELQENCGVNFDQLIRILERLVEDKILSKVDFDHLFDGKGYYGISFPKDFRNKAREYDFLLKENKTIEAGKGSVARNGHSATSGSPQLNFPHRLPAGTKWENFAITFLDDERVRVEVQGKSETLGFAEIGFTDKRNSKPNYQWTLLRLLAKHGGKIGWRDSGADDKIKKCKERLAAQLQSYFRIDYDPFTPYRDTQSYNIKITLIPPPEKEASTRKGYTEDEISDEVQQIFDGLIVEDE